MNYTRKYIKLVKGANKIQQTFTSFSLKNASLWTLNIWATEGMPTACSTNLSLSKHEYPRTSANIFPTVLFPEPIIPAVRTHTLISDEAKTIDQYITWSTEKYQKFKTNQLGKCTAHSSGTELLLISSAVNNGNISQTWPKSKEITVAHLI